MTGGAARGGVRASRRPAILVDLGGVLVHADLTAAATHWGSRLAVTPRAFIDALFAGNDDQVLVGRTGEAAWWRVVADRLGVDGSVAAEIRDDLTARRTWDHDVLAGLRRLRGRAAVAIVSNAWPHMRAAVAEAGVQHLTEAVVLSCEVGCAKPDPRIFRLALDNVGAEPADALFIDDTPGHVDAARSLGLAGHVHTDTAGTLARIGDVTGVRLDRPVR